MMTARRAVFSVVIFLMLGLWPVASSAGPACSGGAVVKTDPGGNVSDPFATALSQSENLDGVDLTEWSVEWTQLGDLKVSWDVTGNPSRLPTNHRRVRFFLFGYYQGSAYPSPPYVFVEGSGLRGGPITHWTYGIGEHTSSGFFVEVQHAYKKWVDLFRSVGSPLVTNHSISVTIPAKRMYEYAPYWSRWNGITRSMSEDSETPLFYGEPTAPSAATAVDGPSPIAPWGIADASPTDRIQGNAYSGYQVQWRADRGNPPELCRPDPVMTTSTTSTTCAHSFVGTGPAWFAARFDVNLASLQDAASGQFSGVVDNGSSGAIALVSPSGEMDFHPFPNDGNDRVVLGVGNHEIDGPILAAGQAFTGVAMNLIPHEFPHTGSWWFLGLIATGTSGRFDFSASGSGLTCGPQAQGSSVQFIRSINFHGGVRVDALPNGVAYTGIVHDAEAGMKANNSALAFLTGGSEVTSSVWEKAPNGDMQYGWALDPPGTPAETRPAILDIGPAGSYQFGIRRSTGGGGLLFADIALP